MLDKIFKTTGWVTIIITFVGILYISSLMFYPPTLLEINSAVANTPTIKAGDKFYYTIDYCRYFDGSARVSRTFHRNDESAVEITPEVQTITSKGCAKVKIPLQTSPTMEKGDYFLLVDIEISPNGLRTEHVVFKVENITIK